MAAEIKSLRAKLQESERRRKANASEAFLLLAVKSALWEKIDALEGKPPRPDERRAKEAEWIGAANLDAALWQRVSTLQARQRHAVVALRAALWLLSGKEPLALLPRPKPSDD